MGKDEGSERRELVLALKLYSPRDDELQIRAHIEDPNQLAHPRSLIRFFDVHMNKLCILGYPEKKNKEKKKTTKRIKTKQTFVSVGRILGHPNRYPGRWAGWPSG